MNLPAAVCPTKAGIISAPQKRDKTWVYSPDMCAQQEDLKKRSDCVISTVSWFGLFQMCCQVFCEISWKRCITAAAQCLNVSPPPVRVNNFITDRDVSSFQTFTFMLLCSYANSKWWNSLCGVIMSLWCLVSVFTRDRNQALGEGGGIRFFVILSLHKSNSFNSIKEGPLQRFSRALWTVEKPSRAFKTYFNDNVCANLRFL